MRIVHPPYLTTIRSSEGAWKSSFTVIAVFRNAIKERSRRTSSSVAHYGLP